MINESVPGPNDVCEMDGDSINEIMIVGKIVSKNEENMRIIMELEDSTGFLNVTFYTKSDNTPSALQNFEYK